MTTTQVYILTVMLTAANTLLGVVIGIWYERATQKHKKRTPVEGWYQYYDAGQSYGDPVKHTFSSQKEKDAFDAQQRKSILSEYVEVEKPHV